jgi:methylenetetrahydrofolate dehydrogenase (NADP+)/methenyltetrahydrofolate cyclohydrolase
LSWRAKEGAIVSAIELNGKALATQMQAELATEVAAFVAATQVTPKLAAVLVGDDPASQVYVRNKQRACEKAGIASVLHRLAVDTCEADLLALIADLNRDPSIHGILIQLPLPKGIDATRVLDAVSPLKDVDAFHPENVGLLAQGRPRFLPCTPHGVLQILHRYEIPVDGKHVVVIGRSDIVGKPLALMLMQRTSSCGSSAANATVTVCHSRTRHLEAIARQADVLVAAIGVARFVTAAMVAPGATVIDVGINRTDAGLVGDVDYEAVLAHAGAITPVPGGVGPMTITMLLRNTLQAAQLQRPV